MTQFFQLRRHSTTRQMTLALVFLMFSLLLLGESVSKVSEMRDIGLPSAIELPRIQQRASMLKEQNNAMELAASLISGSNEEVLRAYVLPSHQKMDRTLAAFDAVLSALRQSKHVSNVTAIRIGETDAIADRTHTPLSFEADVSQEGMALLTSFIDLSGLITVNDALNADDRRLLLSLTEQENPAAVTALEQFLATDIASYAHQSKQYDDRLLQSFASDAFAAALRRAIDGSTLSAVKQLLTSKAGTALTSQKLWPTQFMTLSRLDSHMASPDRFHISVVVDIVGRIEDRP